MTPEIQQAFNGFVVIILTVAGVGVTSIGLFLKASFERRVKKMAEDAETERKASETKLEEDRKDREQKRNIEMEEMRQRTATAQAAAEQAQAVGENLINLNSTMIKLIDTHVAEQHANRNVLTNHAESLGVVGQSIDRMATTVNENTVVTRATGTKSDNVVTAVNELKLIMTNGVDRIIQLLSEDDAKADGEAAA